jgi:putative ABC transport system permease protein
VDADHVRRVAVAAGLLHENPDPSIYSVRVTHLRRLVQLPVFTAVSVLILAIGIGANAAIFTVVDGVLLKPLLYQRADELVVLDQAAAGLGKPRTGAAPFLYFTPSARTVASEGRGDLGR